MFIICFYGGDLLVFSQRDLAMGSSVVSKVALAVIMLMSLNAAAQDFDTGIVLPLRVAAVLF